MGCGLFQDKHIISVESLIITKPLFPCLGAVLIGVQTLLKPGSTGLLLSVQLIPTSTTTKCKAQRKRSYFCQWLWPPFALPEAPLSCRWAQCFLAWIPPTDQVLTGLTPVFSLAPQGKSIFPEAGVMTCVSAKASLSTFPDLQMREASPRS